MNKKIKDPLFKILGLASRRFYSYIKSKFNTKYSHNPLFYINGVKDEELDPRNYKTWDIAWNIIIDSLPTKVDLFDWVVLDQGRTNHCVAYASTAGRNSSCDYIEDNTDTLWIKYDRLWPVTTVNYIRSNLDKDIDKEWTYIINGPKALKALGKVQMYTQVDSLLQLKYLLSIWVSVITWSNKIDWYKTGIKWVVVLGNWGWHAIHINWYDDNIKLENSKWEKFKWGFRIKNTWGNDWWLGGHYWIPYELYWSLYNGKFWLWIDEELTKAIEKWIEKLPFKDMVRWSVYNNWIIWAKDNWIVSWYADWTLGCKDNIQVDRFLAILKNYHDKVVTKSK